MRQSDIAELTDLPRTYISHLEKGEVNVTVETIERIALALKVNPLVLLIEEAFSNKI
jgi:transcriptional regulator with XRE-family HTH domain